VPHVNRAIDEAVTSLSELDHNLPVTRAQVAEIRTVYDSGRAKVYKFWFCPS
jgi:hypothetical protein